MNIEQKCEEWIRTQSAVDAAHTLDHIQRVVANVKMLAQREGGDSRILLPAAWLHDCVSLPKDSPERSTASKKAAAFAIELLDSWGYERSLLPPIAHAIEAHSFSAGIPPLSQEAKIIQDGDRLDALGAIGIIRCLQVGAALGRAPFNSTDPLCESRTPDEATYSLDHAFVKLFRLPELMNTKTARLEANRRVMFIRSFLHEVKIECGIFASDWNGSETNPGANSE
jgi:uncharacterized protein